MDVEVRYVEEVEEEVAGLLRRLQGGRPRKDKEEGHVAPAAGDVIVNESPSGTNGAMLEEKGGEGWVGAAVNGLGEDCHSEEQVEETGEEVVVEEEEVLMQGSMEKTDSWDISGVRGFSEDEEQDTICKFRRTDSTGVEEYALDTAEAFDEKPGHGSSFEPLKDGIRLENGAGVEVVAGLFVEGITNREHTIGVVGVSGLVVEGITNREHMIGVVGTGGGEDVILEEANTEETIEEDDAEETEYDVERVLEKQDTHDLFCPNCRSCITRRVVLCRKRRKVRTGRYRLKVGKVERVPVLDSSSEPAVTAEDRNVSATATDVRDDRTSVANEVNEEREVFRCLSCFSFFISTGDGPKMFWNFGGKKLGEDTRVLPPELPPAETNGFFSFLMKGKVAIEQAKTAAEEPRTETREISESLITNGMIAHQNGVSLAMKGDFPAADSSPSIYRANTLQSEPIVETTTIKIEQTTEGKVTKHEHSKVIQSSASASWVLGQTHIEIDHTTVTETAKGLSATKGLSTLPEASATVVDSLSAPGKQLIKDIEDLSLQSAQILQDAVNETLDDVIVVVESTPAEEAAPQTGARTSPDAPQVVETSQDRELDIVKSIVYGGMIESITSLGIVSSAAGGGASTLSTLALALANLFGGLFVFAHNLRELKNEQPSTTTTGETQDRYAALLGNRRHFLLHATIVILSFVVFGAVAPVTYAFSFRKSNSRDYKLAAVAGASLSCIVLLAIGKAYVRRPTKSYIKTVSYYLVLGVSASGISFLAGELFDYLLQKLGWFSSTSSSSFSGPLSITVPTGHGYASN